MKYKPEQLPYRGYVDYVKDHKKQHDHDGCGYPLWIEVFDKTTNQKLMEQKITNVWDYKSKPTVTAMDDWQAPIIIRVMKSDGMEIEDELDDVRVDPIETEPSLPPFADYFGDDWKWT